MKVIFSFLFIVGLLTTTVNAQQVIINGYLKDSVTHFPIGGGSVTNVNSGKKITTDPRGYFRMEANLNDFIYVLARSYQYDTLTFSFLSTGTITIYLSPGVDFLPTVTVRALYSKYQSDSIQRRAAFESGLGTKMKTVSAPNNSGFGIALNLDKFFKDEYKGRKRSEKIFENLEESVYTDYRFSPHIVAYYTGYKGDTLQAFMHRYTPDYNWLRQHPTHEDVMYYINEKLKEFKSLK
ncbi:MAG: hypothetical protein JWQ96_1107 [Segetibacter sp.]|nr:hypothetical protein [Segetibacter sp.]